MRSPTQLKSAKVELRVKDGFWRTFVNQLQHWESSSMEIGPSEATGMCNTKRSPRQSLWNAIMAPS